MLLFASVADGAATVPPPRLRVCLDDQEAAIAQALPLLRERGYVLLEGLEDMNAEQMRSLMMAIAGDSCTMLKFNAGEYGDNCATAVPE